MIQAELDRRKQIEEALLEKDRKEKEKIDREKKRQEDKKKRLEQMRIDFIAEMQRKESELKFHCIHFSKIVRALIKLRVKH